MAEDSARATPHTEQAHRRTGAKYFRTPHTQHHTAGGHTSEQEPSLPPHGRRNTTQRAHTPVNRSGVAKDTAHATQRTERAHR